VQTELRKKVGVWGLWLISALVPLSFFFTGPIELAQNLEGPGRIVPANGQSRLETGPLPFFWQRFNLWIRCESDQDCASLRTTVQTKKTVGKPFQGNQNEATYQLQTNNPQAPDLELVNPTDHILVVQKYSLTNYSAINTGPPRFAVLLSPYPSPAFPLTAAFLLALGTVILMIPSLIFFGQRGQSRGSPGLLWVQLFFPWFILAIAMTLRLKGVHLLLSWESLMVIAFPGYLFLALTSKIFKERILVPLLVALIVATFLVLMGTVLGVGLPIQDFGPELIHQKHFTKTAQYAGLIYLVLAFGLYWRKREWFSPDKHLFLSSIWFVFLPCLIIYLANGHSGYGGDTTFNSLLPWRIIQGEGLFFPKEYVAAKGGWGLLEIGDAYLPTFPMGPGFLGLPTALIQYFWSTEPINKLIAWNQKVTAVWVAALSAAVVFQMVYLLSRKLWLSLILSAAFALGTTQATISAAVLWQHGPAVLLISLGLFFLVKGQQGKRSFYPLVALPLAFLPLMRSQAVFFYLAGFASVMILQPKMVLRFFFWSIPGIGLTLLVNLGLYHSILGGYGYQASGSDFSSPFLEGAIGSLFSPNRGLFIFSPFLLLGVIGGGILWAKRSVIALSFGLAALLFFLVHAKYVHWHGGYCVAPRFSSELIPVLVFFSVYWFLEIKRFSARLTGWALIIISIVISLPGFFFMREQGQWNVFPDVDHYRQERVWDYRDWLPMHFLHLLGLEHFKETPAYAFVVTGSPEPLKSKEHHYRVKVNLERTPVEIIKLTNIALGKGCYQIVFKGDSQYSAGAVAEFITGFIGYKIEDRTLPIERHPSFILTHIIEVEKTGWVDVRLKISGQGTLILDTIQIVPVKKQPSPQRIPIHTSKIEQVLIPWAYNFS